MTKFLTAALLATVLLVSESYALEDTPENRMAQIERYLAIMPPDEMLDEIVENVATNM